MAINRKVDVDDSGDHLSGTPHTNAWLQDLQDRIDALVGDWTPVTYDAAAFSSDTGTFVVAAGDVVRHRYKIVNKTLEWDFVCSTATITGTPSQLRIRIPAGTFPAALAQYRNVDYLNQGGVLVDSLMTPGTTQLLYLTKKAGGNFAASADATSIYFSARFELA